MDLRAVIFDYGEVLSGPPASRAHRNLLEISGLSEEFFERSYWKYRLEYDANILNGTTYWQRIAEDNGLQFTPNQIERLNQQDAAMWMDLNPSMLAWSAELKGADLRLGILSNMGDEVLRHIRGKCDWLGSFHHCTWSCEFGIVKPDRAIYLHTIEKLGVGAGEALFIDNLEKNVAAAEAAGLHAVLFESTAQLSRELERRRFNLPMESLKQAAETSVG